MLVYAGTADAASDLEYTLNIVYDRLHRSRIQPCAHASVDEFRIVRICSARARAGYLCIYLDTRLLFVNNILDGFGVSEQNLLAQLQRTRNDAARGLELPAGFGLL